MRKILDPINRAVIPNHLLPWIIYLAGWYLSQKLGFSQFTIDWDLWQLLDKSLLNQDPFISVLLLHSQPPGLNSLIIIVLKLANILNTNPALIAKGLFTIVGFSTGYLLYRLIWMLTKSTLSASFATILLSFNPATWYYGSLFFYPFLLVFLFTLLGYMILLFQVDTAGKDIYYLGTIIILIVVITYTRSLYPALWGLVLFGIIVYPRFFLHSKWKRETKRLSVVLSVTLLCLILLWPLKNKLIFNQYTSSSWVGYNLSRGTSVSTKRIDDFKKTGAVPEDARAKLDQFQKKWGFPEPNVLSQTQKSSGSQNWNHYLFLVYNPELKKQGILYRITNPLHWIKQTIYHYLTWTIPSFQEPYNFQFLGPSNDSFQQYTKYIEDILFYNLRPLLKKVEPEQIEWPHVIRINKPVPYTLYGLFLFPFLMVLSWRITRKHLLIEKLCIGGFYSAILFCILWVLIVPCLTDGYESNRMRFAVLPYQLTFLAVILKNTGTWLLENLFKNRNYT